jgi:glycosyltransferase
LKVSIITAAFNSEKTIYDTLQSVASQSYSNIEHIIIDGASKDSTLKVVSEFNHLAQLISEPDNGIYDAMNKGIQLASGDIIGILNSDDVYNNEYVIQDVVDQFKSSKAEGIYGNLVFVDSINLEKIKRKWNAGNHSERKWLFGWMPPHPTFFVKRTVYQNYGLFDTSFSSSADYELMLRVIYKNKINVSYLNKILVKMRLGGKSTASINNRIIANKEDRKAWEKNGLTPYFFTTKMKPIRKIYQFLPF